MLSELRVSSAIHALTAMCLAFQDEEDTVHRKRCKSSVMRKLPMRFRLFNATNKICIENAPLILLSPSGLYESVKFMQITTMQVSKL